MRIYSVRITQAGIYTPGACTRHAIPVNLRFHRPMPQISRLTAYAVHEEAPYHCRLKFMGAAGTSCSNLVRSTTGLNIGKRSWLDFHVYAHQILHGSLLHWTLNMDASMFSGGISTTALIAAGVGAVAVGATVVAVCIIRMNARML
jgi:hypothetical protein